MTETGPPFDCAEQALHLLPLFGRWIKASVREKGLGQDLSLSQFGVLYLIGEEGITSPGQLARRIRVTPAVVTGLLDRLERRDLVRREIDPTDRRRLRLVLTESGSAACRAIGRGLAAELATQLATAAPAELDELSRALVLLERALTALEARTPGATDDSGLEDDEVWSERSAPAPDEPAGADDVRLVGAAPRTASRRRTLAGVNG